MARNTVEDLEDNIWYRPKYYKNDWNTAIQIVHYRPLSQTPVSSYAYVLWYPLSSNQNVEFHLTDTSELALLRSHKCYEPN